MLSVVREAAGASLPYEPALHGCLASALHPCPCLVRLPRCPYALAMCVACMSCQIARIKRGHKEAFSPTFSASLEGIPYEPEVRRKKRGSKTHSPLAQMPFTHLVPSQHIHLQWKRPAHKGSSHPLPAQQRVELIFFGGGFPFFK